MNFVIFPMFFASSALYPLWRVKESSPLLYYICELNPFTHATELIRFALYEQVNWISLAVLVGCTVVFLSGAILAYDPGRGFLARRNTPAAEALCCPKTSFSFRHRMRRGCAGLSELGFENDAPTHWRNSEAHPSRRRSRSSRKDY